MKYTIKLLALTIATTSTLSACGRARYAIHDNNPDVGVLGDGAGKETICDPFSSENKIDPSYGLKGSLHYLEASQPRYMLSTQYRELGTKVDADLFLSRLNVPTRSFATGFKAEETGDSLKDEKGALLTEWFGLDLNSTLTLGANDLPGKYQLAILSDDGSSLRLQMPDGSFQTVINNESHHQTQLACSTTALNMTKDSRVKMNLTYFQGPKFHISLVVMWRPWPTKLEDVADPLCGQSGNDLFFDSKTSPSTPKQAYNDLLARGWRPLNQDNFLLQEGSNKCSEQ